MAPEIKIKPKNNNDVIGHSSDVMVLERKWERRKKMAGKEKKRRKKYADVIIF